MELWQLDVMGNVHLSNGIALSLVTGIDDHSRFCVIAKLVPRATARPVCDALLEGLSRYGAPEQILTDIQTELASFQILGSSGRRDEDRRDRRPSIAVADRTEREARLLAC
jgi:hypothetical protein